jgi:hypothetical protein
MKDDITRFTYKRHGYYGGEIVVPVCETCKRQYDNPAGYERKRVRLRFCSRSCYLADRWITKDCAACHQTFKFRKSASVERQYCSRKCSMSIRKAFSSMTVSNWDIYNWSKAVRSRDGVCKNCGGSEELEGHHVLSVYWHPELTLTLANGIALCRACHRTTETYGTKVEKLNEEVRKMESVSVKATEVTVQGNQVELIVYPISADALTMFADYHSQRKARFQVRLKTL